MPGWCIIARSEDWLGRDHEKVPRELAQRWDLSFIVASGMGKCLTKSA